MTELHDHVENPLQTSGKKLWERDLREGEYGDWKPENISVVVELR